MINKEDIQQLMTQVNEPVLTLYLNVNAGAEENQAATPAWRIWLKNTLKELGSRVNDQQPEQSDLWKQIAARAESYFAQFRASSRALVMFIGANILQEYPLPLPTENRADFGSPLVVPLMWMLDEYERYLIVLVDQEKAYFLTAYLGHVGEEDRMEIDIEDYDWGQKTINPATSYGPMLNQGNNVDAFESMIDEHRARYYRDVAAHVEAMQKEHQANRIVLGGSEYSAHQVRGYLASSVAPLVIGVLPIPMRDSTTEILKRVMPTALEYERQHESTLVEDVINLAKADGRGALGKKHVMEALEQQRVEMLIVPYPLHDAALETELPMQVLASSGEVELVHGDAAERLKQEGGIAARLYYTL